MVGREQQSGKSITANFPPTASTKQELLDQIKADIIEHRICPHLAKQANGLVFGEGDPDADIVFIGEAPGKKEDELLQPFVGASGKFLAEMLASINLKREQVYITNIVKYRPPQNRDPLPEEKKLFFPFLMRQLEVIRPLLVVTLGRHSGEAFIPGLKISQDHGRPKRLRLQLGEVEGGEMSSNPSNFELRNPNSEMVVVVLPLYHPAAALYNGSQRTILMDDFSLIPAILHKIRLDNN